MKGWVGLVGWPIADGLPTLVVTHQLQVERRTGKVRRPETDVLTLCHATSRILLRKCPVQDCVRSGRRAATTTAGSWCSAAGMATPPRDRTSASSSSRCAPSTTAPPHFHPRTPSQPPPPPPMTSWTWTGTRSPRPRSTKLGACCSDPAACRFAVHRVTVMLISSQPVFAPTVLRRCWLGGGKGIRPVKNQAVGCWRGCLSGARCRLAYGPADATATHCLLLQ